VEYLALAKVVEPADQAGDRLNLLFLVQPWV
jgi:hypothetical protein